MKFGLLSYGYTDNIGDEIQSLAASQFLPRVDIIVERDRLHWQKDGGDLFVILNGWFTHQYGWPPPRNIHPLFVSFYAHRPNELIKAEFREYFRAHEPIGCRSPATARALMNIGVDAYFSGCLTLTLQRPETPRQDHIYAVDVEEDLYDDLIPRTIREKCVHLTHAFPPDSSGIAGKQMWRANDFIFRAFNKLDQRRSIGRSTRYALDVRRHSLRMKLAGEMLDRYKAAKLVITSRLHVAMPCLALGTPVILLKRGIRSDVRFEGLRDLVTFFDENTTQVVYDWNTPPPNPERHVAFAEKLRERCRSAVEAATRGEVLANC